MNLSPALKKHFGYAAFRPLQEEIVRDALAGRDVFAPHAEQVGHSGFSIAW